MNLVEIPVRLITPSRSAARLTSIKQRDPIQVEASQVLAMEGILSRTKRTPSTDPEATARSIPVPSYKRGKTHAGELAEARAVLRLHHLGRTQRGCTKLVAGCRALPLSPNFGDQRNFVCRGTQPRLICNPSRAETSRIFIFRSL